MTAGLEGPRSTVTSEYLPDASFLHERKYKGNTKVQLMILRNFYDAYNLHLWPFPIDPAIPQILQSSFPPPPPAKNKSGANVKVTLCKMLA